MSYHLGGLNALFGPTFQLTRPDNQWYTRGGRRDMNPDPRYGCGYGSRNKSVLLWPKSALCSGDRAADYGTFGNDWADGADFYESWSPWQRSMRGNGRAAQFTAGYTYNSSGGIIGGAIVQIFRTADDLYVGQVSSNDQGWYQAWSVYPGQQHYFVAYSPGAPDVAGTTVNTLTPT